MRVLLASLPIREWAQPNIPPMSLLYLSAILRENGHIVTVFDINGHRHSVHYVDGYLKTADYDLLGVTGLITQWNYVRWFTDRAKHYHPDKPIVAGGPMVSNSPDLFAQRMKSVDCICVGEGERAILDIVRDVEKGVFTDKRDFKTTRQPLDGKKGRGGGLVDTIQVAGKPVYQAPMIINLDEIPFPDYDNLDTLSTYLHNPIGWLNKRKWLDGNPVGEYEMTNLGIVSTRSCPFHCFFCNPRYLGRTPRMMSPKRVVDLIQRLHESYGVKYIHHLDELTFFSKGYALRYAEEIIRRGLNKVVVLGAPARIDVLDKEALDMLVEANFKHLGLGIESLSPDMLKAMGKYQQLEGGVERVIENLRYARQVIEDVDCSFIIGFPGETRDTLTDCIRNMKRVEEGFKPNVTFWATPYPSTWLWEYAVSKGFIRDPVQHVESLGENSVQLLMNFTDIPEDELRVWKKRLEEADLDVNEPSKPTMMVYEGVNYSYPT